MTSRTSLQKYVDGLVSLREKQGRNLQADLFVPESFDGLTLLLYNKDTDQMLRVGISSNAIISGKVYEIIEKAFNTPPFHEPTPLERLL